MIIVFLYHKIQSFATLDQSQIEFPHNPNKLFCLFLGLKGESHDHPRTDFMKHAQIKYQITELKPLIFG